MPSSQPPRPMPSAAKRVIIESPYAGDVARNLRYVRACMRDAFLRGEAPYASHALYTQPGVLRDDVPEERELGIRAGFAWRAAAEVTAVYQDLGISGGMQLGVEHAATAQIEYRELGSDWHERHVERHVDRIAALEAKCGLLSASLHHAKADAADVARADERERCARCCDDVASGAIRSPAERAVARQLALQMRSGKP